jgi:hypothetical protein
MVNRLAAIKFNAKMILTRSLLNALVVGFQAKKSDAVVGVLANNMFTFNFYVGRDAKFSKGI